MYLVVGRAPQERHRPITATFHTHAPATTVPRRKRASLLDAAPPLPVVVSRAVRRGDARVLPRQARRDEASRHARHAASVAAPAGRHLPERAARTGPRSRRAR